MCIGRISFYEDIIISLNVMCIGRISFYEDIKVLYRYSSFCHNIGN